MKIETQAADKLSSRILVVDDEPGIREGCRKILMAEGFTVQVAENGLMGLETATNAEKPFDLVLADLKMPGMDGVEMMAKMREHDPEIITIVITAYATLETAIETTRNGAYGYVPKPFTPDEMLRVVYKGLEKRRLSLQAKKLQAERERNLLEVGNEHNRCHAILNCMRDGLIVVNRHGQFAMSNPAAMAMFDRKNAPRVGMPLKEFSSHKELVKLIDETLANSSLDYSVIAREIKIGNRTVMANIAPVKDDANAILGAVVAMSDITKLKQLEQAKATFISMVSHEIKAPLAAIENFLELILDGTFSGDKAREVLLRAKKRIENTRHMIKDLLNMSAMDAGVIGKNKQRIRLNEALDDAIATQQEAAHEMGVEIVNEIANSEATVLADRDDIVKLFTNLISNAVKYNHKCGTVTIGINENGDWLKVFVRDTGIGMTPKQRERIFDEFYRVRNEQTARIGGTGLGMAIVKKIVDACHGDIFVDSEPDKGTTCTVLFREI